MPEVWPFSAVGTFACVYSAGPQGELSSPRCGSHPGDSGDLDQEALSADLDGLGSGAGPQLAIQRSSVRLHRIRREIEVGRDLAEAQSAGEPTQDVDLSCRERIGMWVFEMAFPQALLHYLQTGDHGRHSMLMLSHQWYDIREELSCQRQLARHDGHTPHDK